MSLFPIFFFGTISAFSLYYGEYGVRSFLPNGVFLPCDHGLDFFTSAYVRIQSKSINQSFRGETHSYCTLTLMTMCVCVWCCVAIPFILDVKRAEDIYQPGSHRRKVKQEEGQTEHLPSAVPALNFLARRIQPFLSLVDREVEFCVLTN